MHQVHCAIYLHSSDHENKSFTIKSQSLLRVYRLAVERDKPQGFIENLTCS